MGDGTSWTSWNPAAALSGSGGARENCGKGIREGVSTAERTEEIDATSLTAVMACYVKLMLARVPSTG